MSEEGQEKNGRKEVVDSMKDADRLKKREEKKKKKVECIFFFFKQKRGYEIKECEWSSDVCSSDLDEVMLPRRRR